MTEDEKKLEKIFGKLDPNRPKCNFVDCLAGSGLAWRGVCNLGGNPQDPNCPKFIDEDKENKRQEEVGMQ